MGKFSLLTVLTLNAAGFNKGIDQAKVKTNQFKQGAQQMGNSVKQVFSGFGNLATPINSQLGVLQSGTSGIIKGFKNMIPAINGVKAALISTGIGAIIIGITVALVSLHQWMMRTDEGADFMREQMNRSKAASIAFGDALADLGGKIFEFIKSGDALESLKDTFQNVKDYVSGIFSNGVLSSFKNLEGGIDEFVNGFKTKTLNFFQDMLDKFKFLGGIIGKIFKGEINEALSDIKKIGDTIKGTFDSFSDSKISEIAAKLGKSYDEIKSKADALSAKQREILDFEVNYATTRINIEKEIAENQLKARDKEKYSAKERQVYLEKWKSSLEALMKLDMKKSQLVLDEQRLQMELGKNKTEDYIKEDQLKEVIIRKEVEYTNKLRETLEVSNSIVSSLKQLENVVIQLPEIDTSDINIKPIDIPIDFGLDDDFEPKMASYTKTFSDFFSDANVKAQIFGDLIGGVGDAFIQFAETGEFSMKNLVMSTLDGIRQIINALLVQALANQATSNSAFGIPGLALAAVGMAGVQALFASLPAFASGGIVGGSSYSGDKILSRLNSGEMVLNRSQQGSLLNIINGGGTSGDVEFKIKGDTLVGVLSNHSKKLNSYR